MGLVLFITELAESQRIALLISQSPRVLHYPSVYPANVTVIRCYMPLQIHATAFFPFVFSLVLALPECFLPTYYWPKTNQLFQSSMMCFLNSVFHFLDCRHFVFVQFFVLL